MQNIEQHENNCKLANHKCHFQREGGLVNRGYGAEEELSACRIRARYIRVVQVAGLGCVQPPDCRIARNDNIRVIAEPLHAAIPNISVNVIIGARGHPKKLKMPQSGQNKPDDDNAPWKFWPGGSRWRRREELTDR